MSRSPRSNGRKRSRGTAALGASTTRSRSGERSVSVLSSRRMQGGRSGRSGGGSSRNDDKGGNDDDRDMGAMSRTETME